MTNQSIKISLLIFQSRDIGLGQNDRRDYDINVKLSKGNIVQLSSIEIFGVLGSLASIFSLFIAAPNWKSRTIHVAYSLFFMGLGIWFMNYQTEVEKSLSELENIKRIERQAEYLNSNVDLSTSGNMQGYMQAALAFLEKNRQLYPETYERAKALCVASGCTESGHAEGNNSMSHMYRMQDASSAMKILIKGVSQLGAE